MEKLVKKYIIHFSYTRGQSGWYWSGCPGWNIVKGSRRFSVRSVKDLEEKARKIWELISETYIDWNAPESLRAPKFLALKELRAFETKVDWQP